mmetsp:Transcript_4545/g.12182  ORF Transcript_4545/g.12182 Transcript_4545/m.12182 type:complete len:207 (+) Transcript_4545:988-1608(+)
MMGLPATFWPRSSRATSRADMMSLRRTRAEPRGGSPSSTGSMSMPSRLLGLTAPCSSVATSVDCQRPGKSFNSTEPGSWRLSSGSGGGGSVSSMRNTPSFSASTAALASSVSANAAIAFEPWSMIWGASDSVPNTSSSACICEVIFSAVSAIHSRGNMVMETYCPLTCSRLPRLVLGQSRMRWPSRPQRWHTRDSLPCMSRPSGCE